MFSALAGLFWPHVCPICSCEAPQAAQVHARCLAGLERAGPAPGGQIRACFEDGPQWFSLLHQWKYGGEFGLAAVVARCMAERNGWICPDAVLVPVPDDPGRRVQRGFSPVTDLALALGRETGLPVDLRLLVRSRSTASQTSCADDRARRTNISGAFRAGDLSRWPRDRALVLVEDQVTSGATVNEAAGILAARGAPVRVWCAARAARAPTRLDADEGRH